MQLDDILQGERALLYMERYVDEGTRTYSPFAAKSEVAPQFRPRSDRPSFRLIAVHAPRDQVSIFDAGAQKNLSEFYVRQDEVLFLIHPETWESTEIDRLDELRELRSGEPIEVEPTASTRTVLTLAKNRYFPHQFV